MLDKYEIVVPKPLTWKRAIPVVRPKSHRHYAHIINDPIYDAFKDEIGYLAKQAGIPMIDRVRLTYLICIPATEKIFKRKASLILEPMQSRGDVDNYLKAPMDGFNGIVYQDDKHVLSATSEFRWIPPDCQPYAVPIIERMHWTELVTPELEIYARNHGMRIEYPEEERRLF